MNRNGKIYSGFLIFGVLLVTAFLLFSSAQEAGAYCIYDMRFGECEAPYQMPIKKVPKPPNTAIAYPANGQVLNEELVLLTGIDNIGDALYYSFEYFDGFSWYGITNPPGYEPTTRWNVDDSLYQVYFDTTVIPPGELDLRFTAVYPHFPYIDRAGSTVVVNKPPTASATASHDNNTGATNFDGSTSTDSDGTITKYEWDFGDGSTGTGKTTAHTYADQNTGKTYNFILTVTDNKGAKGYRTYKLVFGPPGTITVTPVDTCGCKKMTIKTAGNANIPFPSPHYIGAANKKALGLNTTGKMKFNFEVEADLVDGSKSSLCGTKQWAKDNIAWGTGKTNSVGGGFVAAGWTHTDNYTKNSTVEGRTATKIYWIDAPGFRSWTAGHYKPSGATWDAKFKTKVFGTGGPAGGDCDCTFEYHWAVDANGTVTTAPNIGNIVCNP